MSTWDDVKNFAAENSSMFGIAGNIFSAALKIGDLLGLGGDDSTERLARRIIDEIVAEIKKAERETIDYLEKLSFQELRADVIALKYNFQSYTNETELGNVETASNNVRAYLVGYSISS